MLTCNASRHTRHSFDMPLTALRCFIWFKFYECFVCFMSFSLVWLLRILEWHTRSCWHSSSCISFFFYYFPNLLPTSKVIDFPHFRALTHSHTLTRTTVFARITTQIIYAANNTKRIAAIVALQHTHWYLQALVKDKQWFFNFFLWLSTL